MAKVFTVQGKNLNKRFTKFQIMFSNTEDDPQKCYFCQNTDLSENTDVTLQDSKITNEMMTQIRTKCATKHSVNEMAKILGVNQSTLWNHMNKPSNSKIIFSNIYNDSNKCFFCKSVPFKEVTANTLRHRMEPIIKQLKQLAGAEQKSIEYMLCQIGKRMCNLCGKRKLAKIFE